MIHVSPSSSITSSKPECLRTDLISWEIGPYYSSLPGPMKLRLVLDGEIVVSGQVETGFLHRGLEKAIEGHDWRASIAYADHLDPEAAIYGELVLCQAVEEIASIDVPARAVSIRVILSELTRLSAHMLYLVNVSRAAGAETLVHYVLRDRERVLDLFELLTGARFSINFLRFGGVSSDVTEGFIERVLEVCDLIRVRIKEYNDLLTFNNTFLKRTTRMGVISPDLVYRAGVTGPNARAAGVHFDVRKAHPYLSYKSLDFKVPTGRGTDGIVGDSHDRFLLRLLEMTESVEILRHVAETIPSGPFLNRQILPEVGAEDYQIKVPSGEAYSRVESSRGMVSCHLISEGGTRPSRIQFHTPTTANLTALPEILIGIRIEDLPVLLASLDLSIAEADR
jgi:NADH-quinone oxidoreductase subunit D